MLNVIISPLAIPIAEISHVELAKLSYFLHGNNSGKIATRFIAMNLMCHRVWRMLSVAVLSLAVSFAFDPILLSVTAAGY